MTRVVRGIGWALAVVIALVLVAAIAAEVWSQRKMNRTLDIPVAPVAFVDDDASIARGKYLFQSRGCGECHGDTGAGRLFIDAPNGLRVWTPNISPGPGSVVAGYTETDWVRAIRHGVKPDGRPLLIMPCEDYNRLTDADLAAVVAYTRRLPSASGTAARFEMPLAIKALYAVGLMRDAPERIDHTLPPAQPVAEGVSVEHGAYVANMCKGCHGAELRGGKMPGTPPDWPAAVDLTARTTYVQYDSAEKFRRMMRGGKRPDGQPIKVMPFETLRQISDTDLDALYLYLRTLPKA